MKNNNKQSKMYTCIYCKNIGETVGVIQKETHYYSLDINTNQFEDFHGDESVEAQEFFCVHCNKKISYRE
ncbi:hypothetical protein KKB43_00260 [Patescibacteria group bacterium]|nr:hypothetical protein [Patescibacteria group bacterium]